MHRTLCMQRSSSVYGDSSFLSDACQKSVDLRSCELLRSRTDVGVQDHDFLVINARHGNRRPIAFSLWEGIP